MLLPLEPRRLPLVLRPRPPVARSAVITSTAPPSFAGLTKRLALLLLLSPRALLPGFLPRRSRLYRAVSGCRRFPISIVETHRYTVDSTLLPPNDVFHGVIRLVNDRSGAGLRPVRVQEALLQIHAELSRREGFFSDLPPYFVVLSVPESNVGTVAVLFSRRYAARMVPRFGLLDAL